MEEQGIQILFAIVVTAVVLAVARAIAAQSDSRSEKSLKTHAGREPALKSARVHRIIDGDTVIVSVNWRKITIRLDAIDCPENGQHWGDVAKFGLIKLIGGRRVRLEVHGLDKHDRTLATIYVQPHGTPEWMNVNLRMVALGHAWVSNHFISHLPFERRRELNQLETWARSRQVGLWRIENPTPPWEWRGQGDSA